MQSFILVGLGGAVGSMGRYAVALLAGRYLTSSFPFATLAVNVLGSFAMGLLAGWLARLLPAWGEEARLLLAVGVLGGFTTFSSFSLDVVGLLERGAGIPAFAYAFISVVISVAALYLGLVATRGVAL